MTKLRTALLFVATVGFGSCGVGIEGGSTDPSDDSDKGDRVPGGGGTAGGDAGGGGAGGVSQSGIDPFGVTKIHPTKSGGEEWYINMEDPESDPRFTPKNEITKNDDGSWKMRASQVRMNVFTSTGYDPGMIESYNPDDLHQRGYMQSPNDWKNFEMTGYVKVNEGSGDNFAWYGRGGRHSDEGCEGTAYKGDLYYDGHLQIAKESWHNSGYDRTEEQDGAPSPSEGWVGFKFVIYNVAQPDNGGIAVKMEMYTSEGDGAPTDWKRVYEFTDDGTWAGQLGHCDGSNNDWPITWGGPIATYRWDSADDVDFKWLSVREIAAPGSIE